MIAPKLSTYFAWPTLRDRRTLSRCDLFDQWKFVAVVLLFLKCIIYKFLNINKLQYSIFPSPHFYRNFIIRILSQNCPQNNFLSSRSFDRVFLQAFKLKLDESKEARTWYPRLIRNWVRGWRKSLVARSEHGESEANVPVVSAIPSRRVLEEPHAAKKRRNGGLKGARKEREPPKKKIGPLSHWLSGRVQSVHVRCRERDRKTDFFARDCSCLFPTGTERKLPSRRTKRHVFRGCTNFRSRSTVSSLRLLWISCESLSSNDLEWVVLEQILFSRKQNRR